MHRLVSLSLGSQPAQLQDCRHLSPWRSGLMHNLVYQIWLENHVFYVTFYRFVSIDHLCC
jgi:hypothetical protein